MNRPWTHKETLFLTQTVNRCGLPWCASELRRTVEECARKLEKLRGDDDGADGWLTPKEAGALASCSATTIRTLLLSGALEGRKDAYGLWRVKREAVTRYASEHGRMVEQGRTREKTPRSPQDAKQGVLQESHGKLRQMRQTGAQRRKRACPRKSPSRPKAGCASRPTPRPRE